MEKHIESIVDTHTVEFKKSIKKWLETNNAQVKCGSTDYTSEFLKFIFDHSSINFNKDDFQKKKRIKNLVHDEHRCIAKRAKGDRCTRHKKDDEALCGTHSKGTPHGVIDVQNVETKKAQKTEVWVQEIKGINYYIDDANNVYKPEDILSNRPSPSIIAKWTLKDGIYTIPTFGI